MKNSIIIDRVRYDIILSSSWLALKPYMIGGIPGMFLQHLDFYIIEEEDGSATFIKNRHNRAKTMTPEEYKLFKSEYFTLG